MWDAFCFRNNSLICIKVLTHLLQPQLLIGFFYMNHTPASKVMYSNADYRFNFCSKVADVSTNIQFSPGLSEDLFRVLVVIFPNTNSRSVSL